MYSSAANVFVVANGDNTTKHSNTTDTDTNANNKRGGRDEKIIKKRPVNNDQ